MVNTTAFTNLTLALVVLLAISFSPASVACNALDDVDCEVGSRVR